MLHRLVKFRETVANAAIFAIFKMAGRHLGFSKTENVNDG